MKILRLLSLTGVILLASVYAGWAAPHGGGGGGFGGGHFGGGGGHVGVGGGLNGGVRAGGPFYYSHGMRFGNSATQFAAPSARMPLSRPHVFNGPNRAIANRSTTNRMITSRPGATNGTMGMTTRRSATSPRPPLGGRTDHIAERHEANWHGDWDRRHAHFDHGRFFIFDEGFWFGLDAGYFPWDYYPYDAYDYYPYDYYPGYYADVEPYYYNEGVYSDTPVADPTVSAVQTQLAQQGYYTGPVDGIFGPETRDAVAKYQIAKQLDVTGSLSAQTLQSFGLTQPTAS
jgi:Putative peptidoglycan-binding domain-containing protein